MNDDSFLFTQTVRVCTSSAFKKFNILEKICFIEISPGNSIFGENPFHKNIVNIQFLLRAAGGSGGSGGKRKCQQFNPRSAPQTPTKPQTPQTHVTVMTVVSFYVTKQH